MFDDVIDRFARQAPAATLFRSLFARVFAAEKLDQVFREQKQRQVEGELLFSTLVELLAPVVSGAKRSVNASYMENEDRIGVSKAAVYDKLQGVEPQVSAALVSLSAQELTPLHDQAQTLAEGPLPGYHVFIIDGKQLDGTEHRIDETRYLKSSPLPGRVLTMYDTQRELFVQAACDRDCYACERQVVLPLLEHLQAGCVYMADRNFCDGPLIERFLDADAYYLLRQHGRSPRWRCQKKSSRKRSGTDRKGGKVFEQAIEVYLPNREEWVTARRITIELTEPTRDQEWVIHLITNLPATVLAVDIANAYMGRWTIETSLGHIAQALNAEINTLAYPGAALLSFCLGLVLFNLVRTLEKLLLHYAKGKTDPTLSHYYLASEIAETAKGLQIAIDPVHWDQYAQMTVRQYLAFVKRVAERANLRKYKKNVRGPKRPPPKRKSGKGRSHVSTQRILLARKC
jgi:hypothetical protein